jgi:hypothetical protein
MELPTKQEIQVFQKKIQNDPVFFIEKVLGNPLWQVQKDIVEAVRDNKEVAVRSCHASGKSYVAGRIVHWYLNSYIDSVVITTAPTFRQVKEVLWREIKGSVAGKHIYPEKAVLDTAINISPQWFALGLSTDKPGQFQGFHSPHLMVLIDEASDIDPQIEEAIDGLTPEKIVRIGNPLSNQGAFFEAFRREGVKKLKISAFDTPNLKGETTIPGLITLADVEKIKAKYGEDSDVYKVRVLGEFPSQDAESLFGVDEIASAINRTVEVKEAFESKLGVDPARFGDDRTAFVIRKMEKVIFKEAYSQQDTMQIAGRTLALAKEYNILPDNIFVDVVGIGAGVVDRLKEQGWNVNEINVGEKAQDEEHYFNQRAELYAGKVKEWIKKADLTEDDDWYELSNIKFKFTSTGKMQLEKKEDIKKRGLPSPDVADALALTFAEGTTYVMPQATEPVKPYYEDLGF